MDSRINPAASKAGPSDPEGPHALSVGTSRSVMSPEIGFSASDEVRASGTSFSSEVRPPVAAGMASVMSFHLSYSVIVMTGDRPAILSFVRAAVGVNGKGFKGGVVQYDRDGARADGEVSTSL